MKKFRDILYDKNDILVAVIILLIAGIVIAFRINSIMSYPDTVVSAANEKTTTETTQPNSDSNNSSGTDSASDKTLTDSSADSDKTSDKASDKVSTIKITIKKGSASQDVARQLKKAGLVSSAAAFNNTLIRNNLEDSIQIGTFKIPSDATTKEIIKIITGYNIK